MPLCTRLRGTSKLVRKVNDDGRVGRQRSVGDGEERAVSDKLADRQLEVFARGRLKRAAHVQRVTTQPAVRAHRGCLEAGSLVIDQHLQHRLKRGGAPSGELDARTRARDAGRVPLVSEGGRVQPVAPHVHRVVVEVRRRVCHNLERFVGAHGGDDSVGGRNRRYDVLDHALRLCERDARDPELLRTLRRLREHPHLVLGVVCVRLGRPWVLPLVLDEVRVQHAVGGVARRLGNGAEGHGDLRREKVERALEARRHLGEDDASVPLEPLRATVDHRDDGGEVGCQRTVSP
mmetsp:Transcript_17723/g.45811  ORF Transcript_17723/g.45811 Transcript_17723/m.45811 type:complete len:290 (+) Transcript_17723:99-968(+)